MANANAIVQTITQLCQSDCRHRNNYSHIQTFNCIAVSAQIKNAIDNGIQLPSQTFDQFYDYICRQNYYYDNSCVLADPKSYVPFLKKLFPISPPNTEVLKSLLVLPAYDECYN
ncbi:MAG: hypothetical protein MUO21_02465, partial [Nitrososphaeraceae archaeon]|nr:hypothetical protein [Nitrososphaeraceae archaeon]